MSGMGSLPCVPRRTAVDLPLAATTITPSMPSAKCGVHMYRYCPPGKRVSIWVVRLARRGEYGPIFADSGRAPGVLVNSRCAAWRGLDAHRVTGSPWPLRLKPVGRGGKLDHLDDHEPAARLCGRSALRHAVVENDYQRDQGTNALFNGRGPCARGLTPWSCCRTRSSTAMFAAALFRYKAGSVPPGSSVVRYRNSLIAQGLSNNALVKSTD